MFLVEGTPTGTKTFLVVAVLSSIRTLHHLNSRDRRVSRVFRIRLTAIINGNVRTTLRTRKGRSTPIKIHYGNKIFNDRAISRALFGTVNGSPLPYPKRGSIRHLLILGGNVRRFANRLLYIYDNGPRVKRAIRGSVSRLILRPTKRLVSVLVINVGNKFIRLNRYTRIFSPSLLRQLTNA